MNLDRRWLGVALLLGMLSFAESTSAELLLLISPGGGQRPPDALLRTIDSTDDSTVPGASVTMTLAGHTVIGGSGLARDPQTGELYARLKLEGASSRRLVVLDESTGVEDDVGDTG